ncbi:MAG: T9SS type A sorting domain-containing protein [Saprospiraceae bacterium]|nr:T9SS type A sorting domain-containing protein [Saprospiraceae bacterium]
MTKFLTLFTLVIFVLVNKTASAQCDVPINQSQVYLVSNAESKFEWGAVATATSYRFQLKFPWDDWAEIDVIVPATTYSLIGLAHSFPFEWRVSAICGNVESAFSPTQSYTVPCPIPTGLNATNITVNSAVLNWTPFQGYNTYTAGFVLGYRIANSNAPWISLGSTSLFTKNISGLQSNTTYEWCVNTSCTYFNSSPVISTFTTSSGCGLPVNLRISSTTSVQNRVIWDAVNGALSYTVQYKKNSQTNWTSANSSFNNLLITGLDPETLYDWKVQANCSNGSGVFSTPSQFHTYSLICNSYGVNTNEWIDLFSLGTISRASGKDVGGYLNSNQSTDLVIGSSVNSGQLSAGFIPGFTYGERFVIYIDFNRNGNFADPGELVLSPLSTNNGGTYNFSISIPSTVTPGPTKLKVVMRRGGGTYTPCAQGVRGEVEDYLVNIVTSSNMISDDGNVQAMEYELETRSRQIDQKDISISPNPSNGIFNISLDQKLKVNNYKVLNALNGILFSANLNASGFELDLSPYANGIYHLLLTDINGKSSIVRLIKM